MRRPGRAREGHDLFQRAVWLPPVLDEFAVPARRFTDPCHGHACEQPFIGTDAVIVMMDAGHLGRRGRVQQAGQDDRGVQSARELQLDAPVLAGQRADTAQQRRTGQLHGLLNVLDRFIAGHPHHVPLALPAHRFAVPDRNRLTGFDGSDFLKAGLQAITKRIQQRIGQERPVDAEIAQAQQQAVFHVGEDHRQLAHCGHVARDLRSGIAQDEPARSFLLEAQRHVAAPAPFDDAAPLAAAGVVRCLGIQVHATRHGACAEILVEQLAEYYQGVRTTAFEIAVVVTLRMDRCAIAIHHAGNAGQPGADPLHDSFRLRRRGFRVGVPEHGDVSVHGRFRYSTRMGTIRRRLKGMSVST